ncbi:hypothetical protein R1sor_016328 [Riccia sorocarpa]|uniref:Uncharacterized protein n=1 Tax=Riccia sorocarpa TaxID=122646 RepID=A0ABD3HKW1_9MARC
MDLRTLNYELILSKSSPLSLRTHQTYLPDESNVSATVYRRDKDGVLRSSDSRISLLILEALRKEDELEHVEIGLGEIPLTNGSIKKLTDEFTIDLLWSARSVHASRYFKLDILHRQILTVALDCIKEEGSLIKVLEWKAVAYQSVRVNPYMKPGPENSPYENFIDSLVTVPCCRKVFRSPNGSLVEQERSSEDLYGQILAAVSGGLSGMNLRILECLGLHFVFHGTNQAVMDSILKTGLLPLFRRSGNCDKDWFGVDYRASAGYSKATTKPAAAIDKVLLFLVLDPDVELGKPSQVTSKSNLYQLPLAEIFLK